MDLRCAPCVAHQPCSVRDRPSTVTGRSCSELLRLLRQRLRWTAVTTLHPESPQMGCVAEAGGAAVGVEWEAGAEAGLNLSTKQKICRSISSWIALWWVHRPFPHRHLPGFSQLHTVGPHDSCIVMQPRGILRNRSWNTADALRANLKVLSPTDEDGQFQGSTWCIHSGCNCQLHQLIWRNLSSLDLDQEQQATLWDADSKQQACACIIKQKLKPRPGIYGNLLLRALCHPS